MLSMHTLGSDPGTKAVPNAVTSVVIWLQLVMGLLRPWNSESRAVWAQLIGYRINQLYICKNDTMNEHEYAIVDLSRSEQERHLFLRLERAAGKRKDSLLPHFSSPSSRPSDISSNRYLASDTIEKLDGLPESARIVRMVEFNSDDRLKKPSLWDLMVLVHVIHEGSMMYELFERQCFWFVDTISAILEEWPEAGGNISIIDKKPGSSRFLRLKQQSGSVGVFVVHRRNSCKVGIIRAKFQKQRDNLYKERQEFENAWIKEAREKREMEGKVRSLLEQREAMERQQEGLVKLVKQLTRELEDLRYGFQQKDREGDQWWAMRPQHRLQQTNQQSVSCYRGR